MQKKISKIKDSQSGVTLVVSMVFLAAMTFISFSISTVIIREIVAGRLTLRSEPAISAANSGGEEGLFRLFREAGGVNASGSLAQSGATYQVISDLYDNQYPFSAAAVAGSNARVLLYDAENTNITSANYGSATITLDPTSGLASYEIYSWSDFTIPVCSGSLGPVVPGTCVLNNPTDDRYVIIITWSSGPNISGNVTATDDFGAARGIPSENPKLEVKGTNGPVQRRIEINL